jgi:general secretion pathway protein K
VVKNQRGMVLLMVLLIFSVVAILATTMIERQAVDLGRASTLFAQQQARLFALGAESAAKAGLYLDWEANKEIDHAAEEWTTERTFPLDPGVISLRIQDAQGRFNLNGLTPGGAVAIQESRFRNLLNLLGLDVGIAASWRQWLDKESNVDNTYLSLSPAYRPAYTPCRHTSELMLIENVDLDAYAKIEPYITCLPASAQLNVNTATNFVLAALDNNLTLADADAIIASRGADGFSSVQDFIGTSQINRVMQEAGKTEEGEANNSTGAMVASDFGVTTEYFELFARIDLNGRIGTVEALIHRAIADGSMTTMYRDFSRRAPREVW